MANLDRVSLLVNSKVSWLIKTNKSLFSPHYRIQVSNTQQSHPTWLNVYWITNNLNANYVTQSNEPRRRKRRTRRRRWEQTRAFRIAAVRIRDRSSILAHAILLSPLGKMQYIIHCRIWSEGRKLSRRSKKTLRSTYYVEDPSKIIPGEFSLKLVSPRYSLIGPSF